MFKRKRLACTLCMSRIFIDRIEKCFLIFLFETLFACIVIVELKRMSQYIFSIYLLKGFIFIRYKGLSSIVEYNSANVSL